jgi:2-deoxy-D-gluconate 3-dehydrogenase
VILERFALDGQVALVTGAARGLGQAIAVALAEAGADIAGLDRISLESTKASVTERSRRFFELGVDLGKLKPTDLRELVDGLVEKTARLDILVNNAGIVHRADAITYGEAEWDDTLQVNLKSVFFLSQAAAHHMIAQRHGKIVNVASLMSFQGGIRVPAYAASKSGVAGITRAMANEWAAFGVNVNAIAPGYIETANTAPVRADPTRSAAILARIPANRWGLPSDITGAVVFLASAASDYLHGAILPIDGGWLTR